MLLFYGEGRLGNQILQYQALCGIARPGEWLLAIGLENLDEVVELSGPRLIVLTRSGLLKRLVKYLLLPFFLRPLARTLRLVRYAHEPAGGPAPFAGASGALTVQAGLLRTVVLVDGGYYHASTHWTQRFPLTCIRVQPSLRQAANAWLDEHFGATVRPLFVHVRRGDFVGFSAYGVNDIELPVGYYRLALREALRGRDATPLLFVTDDAAWVEQSFHDIPVKKIVSLSPALDFALMTECDAGVLSNSTFALAAALMIKAPAVLVAPEYWFGFRVERWLPPMIRIEDPRVRYVSFDN